MPLKLKTFFGYFGGKYRAAKHYPEPKYDRIVEPFAGSAGYALHYSDRTITLVERDPEICLVWRYLIQSTERDILRLPLVGPTTDVRDFKLDRGAEALIGWNLTAGDPRPRYTISKFGAKYRPPWKGYENFWGEKRRARIARQVSFIKHWKIIEGQAIEDSPQGTIQATWYIDPPYCKEGKAYRFGATTIDYKALAEWCRSLHGQVIVCEQEGADWLPFKPHVTIKGNGNPFRSGKSKEVIWTK
jgi:site-specific DNA-adenine methylase